MKQSLRMFFSALIVAAGSLPCMAGNGTWTNLTSGGLWSDVGNWNLGAIADGSSSTAYFNTLNLTGHNTVRLDSSRTNTTLKFAAGTGAYDWTLDNNDNAANILTLWGGSTIEVTNRTATISAVIAGASSPSLTKTGAGTLTLTTTNSFTGWMAVSGGTLQLGAASKITPSALTVGGATTATLYLTNGAQVVFSADFTIGKPSFLNGAVIQDGGDVTISASYLRMADAATATASYRMNGGTISLTSVSGSNLQIGRDGAAAFTQDGGTVTVARTTGDAFQLGVISGAVGAYTNSGGLLSVSGGGASQIGGAGTGILAVNGPGSVVNFKGAVSLGDTSGTGTVSFTAGKIRLNTLKKGAGIGTFNWGGGTLSPYDADATVSNSLPLTLTGPNAQFNTQGTGDVARTFTVLSAINENGGSYGLTKTGAGTLTLAGTNTYTGATTVNNGILKFSATGSISNSSRVVVSSGGTCDVSAVTGFTVLPNQTLMGNGVVTGAVTVAAGGILGGTGTVASVVTNNGVITAGETNTVGILTLTNLVMAGDSTYVWNYSDTAQDLINVKGTLSLPNVATVMVSKISGSLPSGAVLFKCGSSGTPDGTTLSSWVIIGARPDSKAVVRTVASQKQVQLVSPTGMILRLY